MHKLVRHGSRPAFKRAPLLAKGPRARLTGLDLGTKRGGLYCPRPVLLPKAIFGCSTS